MPDEGLHDSLEPEPLLLVFNSALTGAGECSDYATGRPAFWIWCAPASPPPLLDRPRQPQHTAGERLELLPLKRSSLAQCRRRRRIRPPMSTSGGSTRATSKPLPQFGSVLMKSQPAKGVPSSVSPVTHASVCPTAMPVS